MAEKLQKYGVRFLLLAGLFAQGTCMAMLYKNASSSAPPKSPPEVERVTLTTATPRDSGAIYTAVQHRQLAERLMLNDDSEEAIPHLLNAAPPRLDDADSDLKFRLALCLEASRDCRRAASLYEDVFNHSDDERLASGARNGLARCRLSLDHPAAARQLLWRQYLQSSVRRQFSQADSDALFWLAMSYGQFNGPGIQDLLDRDYLIRGIRPALQVSHQLRSVIPAAEPTAEQPGAPPQTDQPSAVQPVAAGETDIVIDDIMIVGEGLDDMVASYVARQANLLKLFQWLSTRLETPLGITDRARELASQQSVTLHLEHVNLAAALDSQTLPFGLGWSYEDGNVAIFTLQEAPPDVVRNLEMYSGMRLLERLRILSPDYLHSSYVQFLMAGFLVDMGQTGQAVGIYTDLLSHRIDARLRQATNYNLGQLQSRLREGTVAMEAFSRVIDSNEGGRLQAVSYIKLGQVNLELGQHNRAVGAFSRAWRMSDDPLIRQISILGLGAAYMFDGQQRQAVRELSGDAGRFADGGLRQMAGYLVALGEIDGQDASPSHQQRSRLLSLLSRLDPDPATGTHIPWLMARGYHLLGFHEEAIALLQDGIGEVSGGWLRQQYLEQLVSILKQDGRTGELRSVLASAATLPKVDQTGLIAMELAELEYREGNSEACLTHCRSLLNSQEAASRHAAALRLMGGIFEQRGEYNQAALCFAGLLPSPVSASASDHQEARQ